MAVIAADEAEATQGRVDVMRSINQKTFHDSGHANRSVRHDAANLVVEPELSIG